MSIFSRTGKEAKLIREKADTTKQKELVDNVPDNQLYPVLDSLNALAATPWKINETVSLS